MIPNKYLEALLFAAVKPLDIPALMEIFQASLEDVLDAVRAYEAALASQDRGLRLRRIGDTVELITAPDAAPYVERIRERQETLSASALETLAIIAFKQPITRAEIEEIRGVNSERMIKLLLERELICDMGRKPVLGRPLLYGTTEDFLRSVGSGTLEELRASIPENI